MGPEGRQGEAPREQQGGRLELPDEARRLENHLDPQVPAPAGEAHAAGLRVLGGGAFQGKRSGNPERDLTERRQTDRLLKIESLEPAVQLRRQQRRRRPQIGFGTLIDPSAGGAMAIPSLMERSASGGAADFSLGNQELIKNQGCCINIGRAILTPQLP
jgi:hypothetical protein